MKAITVRGLDEELHDALKKRAHRHGRSMEAEVRLILADTVKADLVYPNVLVEFHDSMREDPVDLELPPREIEAARVTF